MNRTAKAHCGEEFAIGDQYDHLPAPVTIRFKCGKCSSLSEKNPSGLTVYHMVPMAHPKGLEETVGSLGPQP